MWDRESDEVLQTLEGHEGVVSHGRSQVGLKKVLMRVVLVAGLWRYVERQAELVGQLWRGCEDSDVGL